MYGLNQAANVSKQSISSTVVGDVKYEGLAIEKALKNIENELQIQRNLMCSLAERIHPYCDERDVQTSGPEASLPVVCLFEQRLNMSLGNIEQTNNALRYILDRGQF